MCVQSLLTDPYTRVCMEPEVGRLYREHRTLFDRTAQEWTWRYAMHDYLPARVAPSMLLSAPAAAKKDVSSTVTSTIQLDNEDEAGAWDTR